MKLHAIIVYSFIALLITQTCANAAEKVSIHKSSLKDTKSDNENDKEYPYEMGMSFLETGVAEKAAHKMLSLNRLENQLKIKMALSLMENRKKRYTEGGKECAPTFEHNGKQYDDCTMIKTPDNIDAQKEWCYIKPDQVEDNKKDWDFCRPDINYDQIRAYNQEKMRKKSIEMTELNATLNETTDKYKTSENQTVSIENEFKSIDGTVTGLLKTVSNTSEQMNQTIDDSKETSNQEAVGYKLGMAISLVEQKNRLNESSFLALELTDPEDDNAVSGNAQHGTGESVGFVKNGPTYGNTQSDSDEVVGKDQEDSHSMIAPYLQQRTMAATKNGAGMDNYEEDMQGDGLMGKYFDNQSFLGSYYTQKDGQIDFDFTGASPAPGINNENFSIRWAGHVLAPHSGEYQFILDSDGGMSLSVNDQLVLSRNMKTPNQDPTARTQNFLMARIRETSSTSNCPKCVKSLKLNLIGGNKYKIVLSYFHTSADMVKEEDPVYCKMFWQSNIFKKKLLEKKYLFTENVFDPMKITGITPDVGVVRKLLDNDLAFKDTKDYVLTDIPKDFKGLNCLKLNMKYYDPQLLFQINNPCMIYIAFPESYTDPCPADFEETNELINVNELEAPPRHEWKRTDFQAKQTIPFKIKKKSFDAGKINIKLNKAGVNVKSVTMLLFFGYDRFNDVPITCGGEEYWISQPTSPYFSDCKASSQDVVNSRRCEEGLNGEMRDEPHGGSIWGTLNEGEGAWMQVNFKDTFQISRIEYQDRSKQRERNKEIEILFSNGNTKILRKQNTSERREYKIDPPQKSYYVKFTIRKVYSTGNNGGAFKVFGYKCKKATPDDDSPENVGTSFVTGIPQPELPAMFDLNKNKPVKLDCNDKLDSNKFSPHNIQVGSKILINCQDSCVTSDEDLKIYGRNNKYSGDSIICKSALHSEFLLDQVPESGGKLWLTIGPEMYNMTGEVKAGIRSWPKAYCKYTYSFSKFQEEEEIILKEGCSIDLKNPNREGWLPGKIIKVTDNNRSIIIQAVVEGSGPEDAMYEIQYPSPQKMAPCGEFIPGRDCEGSRKNLNTNRPLRWRFITQDYNGSNDIKDYGGIFGSTGKAFGWSKDMTNRVKRRIDTNDPRLETLVEFPPSKKSLVCSNGGTVNCEEATWSVKTGPGIFNVKIGVGDSKANTRLDLKINSNFIVQKATLQKGEFQVYEGSTQAINNFITIRSECVEDCDFQMSKMNFIEISPVLDDNLFLKLNNQKTPEQYFDCGKATKGGRCEETNPENCLYDEAGSIGTQMCTGALNLVQVDPKYKCSEQRDKFKCVRKSWKNGASCNEVCPRQCTKDGNRFLCQ